MIVFFKNRFEKWLKRRIPATKEITLNNRNLFIFPSKNGLSFLLCCFILFLLGTNYQNNLILIMVFFLCSLMITCLLLSYRNLANLTLMAFESEPQFAGKDCKFELRVIADNNQPQDVSFSFQSNLSDFQTVIDRDKVVLYACSRTRGYFNPGRITVRSTFPFGLYTVWTHVDFGIKVLLYPEPIENLIKAVPYSENNSHDSFNQTTLGVDQFSTLKSYQQGESLKSVAWKQLAQGRGWLSKQFEQSLGEDLLLDINSLKHLPLESRLSFLCYQILELDKCQQRYALTLGKQKIEMNSGKRHKEHCLKALALFESELNESKQ